MDYTRSEKLTQPLGPGDRLIVTISGPDPVAPVPVPPPPVPAGGSIVIAAGDPVPLASGKSFLLRGGVHKLAWGAIERHESNVSILPYPGESPVIDGTGLDPHFAYLGSGALGWTLGVELRNFHPTDSGVIGIGDGCSLHTVPGFKITGAIISGTFEQNSHLVYHHGTGTSLLDQPILLNAPGAALHSYRGSGKSTINGGQLSGRYETALLYNGSFTFIGTAFLACTAPARIPARDIDVGDPTVVKASLTACTGTGAGGAVNRAG